MIYILFLMTNLRIYRRCACKCSGAVTYARSLADAMLILYTILGNMTLWNVLYSPAIVIDICIFQLMSRSRTYTDCPYQHCVCRCPGATKHKVISRRDVDNMYVTSPNVIIALCYVLYSSVVVVTFAI